MKIVAHTFQSQIASDIAKTIIMALLIYSAIGNTAIMTLVRTAEVKILKVTVKKMMTCKEEKMRSLLTLEAMIIPVLEKKPETRDSDKELALTIWNTYYGINPWAPLCEVMRNECIPSIESIGRCRRKIQEKDETLRGSKRKEQIRMKEQERYIEYALLDR